MDGRVEARRDAESVLVNAMDRPVIHCLVSYEWKDGEFTEPALVSLELAAELKERGYAVVVDPADERDLATFERSTPWFWRTRSIDDVMGT